MILVHDSKYMWRNKDREYKTHTLKYKLADQIV